IATSKPVYDHLNRLAPRQPGRLIPNGVEFDRFSQPMEEPPELLDLPRPRLIYVGALDARFDWAAVRHLAQTRPDWQIVLIGPGGDDAAARQLPSNVHRLGARPYERVPGYLQH